MKYKKNKLRLNEIQSFYFLFKFGLVLIYILKVYRKRSSSILLRKNMFNYLHFFWKAYTFLSFERFLCWKFRNYSQHVFSKFSADIYLELLIIGGSIFTIYLASAAFSLVCVGSIFFSFFFFFFFYQYFPWRILKIQRIAGNQEEVIIFLSHFHSLTNIHLVHQDFHQFVLTGLFVIARLIADETCSLVFYLYFHLCN